MPIFFSDYGWAQERCAYDLIRKQREQSGWIESERRFENWLKQKQVLPQKRETFRTKENELVVYQIPVVVHVIHNGEAIGTGRNISDQQILSQVMVLNQDYQRLNPDTIDTPNEYKPVAANIQLEFVLAKQDPQGLPTNGITRTYGPRTSYSVVSNEVELKSLSYWPAEDYLNIWVARLGGSFLGFSTFPVSGLPGIDEPEYNRLLDGVVIDYRAFGSLEFGEFPDLEPQYNRGRTTTHEIGHYLGLKHPWGNNTGDCSEDDFCEDTPMTSSGSSGCPAGKADCDSPDMIQNFMDYTDDVCMNLFTTCQKSRIITVLENSPRRVSLLNSPGLISPLENSYDLSLLKILKPANVFCSTSFSPSLEILNLGTTTVDSVQVDYVIDNENNGSFKVYDLNLVQGDRQIVDLPEISLTEGNYNIEISIVGLSNPGSDYNFFNNTKSQQFIIDSSSDFLPYRESFNNSDLNGTGWTVLNPDLQNGWKVSESGSSGLGNSMLMDWYDYQRSGADDWLVSPVMDFGGALAPTLTFNLAYAYRANRTDLLTILASKDCGETYTEVVYEKSGQNLSTASAESAWQPKGEEDWRREIVSLNDLSGERTVRLAFVAINGGGNKLFIDNIELYLDNQSAAADLDDNSVLLHPNPTGSRTVNLTFALDKRDNLEIRVVNTLGQTMHRQSLENVLNQTITMELPGLNAGVYLVQVKNAVINRTVKLLLN